MKNSKKLVIVSIVCCHGNSLQHTHMNEIEIPRVLLIFTVNARSLNLKLKQIVHFQFFILLQVYVLLKLWGATLTFLESIAKYVFTDTIVKIFHFLFTGCNDTFLHVTLIFFFGDEQIQAIFQISIVNRC